MGMLLLEGGVAGHMAHLYDNPELSFKQIKDIFQKAINGELVGTEKTDGQNLFLTYSVAEQKAKAARNKGDIKSGGMSGEALAQKFSGRGSLEHSFIDAFESWQNVAHGFPKQEQIQMFGTDGDIWYNCEVQDPGTANVVNYDSRNLVIHRAGHALFDKKTGNVSSIDVTQNYNILNSGIEKIQNIESKNKFKVINNAVKNLRALHDKKPLKDAIVKLNKLLNTSKLTDNNTIGDYVTSRLNSYISKEIPNLTPKPKENLINKILGTKGLNINKIIEPLPDDQKEKIKIIANNADGVLKQIIAPLEDIVHDFSVEILKGLESMFIVDNNKEIQRLRSEVSNAINQIQNSGHEDAIKILDQQLRKLKKAENVSTAVEGFVFTYNGVVYKLTGNFAPINQILGLFKYGRGKIPPLKDIMKESSKNRIIAIMPGGFKPPHIGHYLGAKYLSEIPNIDEVKIIISLKSRSDETGEIIIDAKKSMKIWNIYIRNIPKIKIQLSKVASPVQDVYNQMETLNPGDTLLVAMGEKDIGDTRFKRAQDWSDKNKLGVKVKPIETKVPEKLMNVSASGLRNLIANNKKIEFMKYLPTQLTTNEKEEVWQIVTNKKINKLEEIIEEGKYKPELVLNQAYELVKRHLPNMSREQFDSIRIPNGMFGTVTPKFYAFQKAEPPEKIAQLVIHHTSKHVEEVIQQSGDKYCLYSKKKDSSGHRKNLGCYPSRGGAENREKQVQYFKHVKENMNTHEGACEYAHPNIMHEQWLEEISTMAGSAVQGGVLNAKMKSPWKNKEMHGDTMIERNKFYNELKEEKIVRSMIQNLIQEIRSEKNSLIKNSLLQEIQLRSVVRNIIIEAKEKKEKVPHSSTGINILEELLKKIIPILEEDYKSLTTNNNQRKSFRAHILNAVQKTLTTADINISAGKEPDAEPEEKTKPEKDIAEEISVSVDDNKLSNEPEDHKKFIDISKYKRYNKTDTFGIEGEDLTGRNMAERSFDKIGKNIIDSYAILGDSDDKKLFYDYLLTNLKLYFDKFESELSDNVKEPEVDTEKEV